MNSLDATLRWRTATSDSGLTWGVLLDGEMILSAVRRHKDLDGADILEIGPGYGRFVRSLVESRIEFASYLGLDISAYWTDALSKQFANTPNVRFVHGEAERAATILPGGQFDLIVSTLTFKHLYPDFSLAAEECSRLLSPHGALIFDAPETDVDWHGWPPETDCGFDHVTQCFTRSYSRAEIDVLLSARRLRAAAFDRIEYMPGMSRLLTIAERQ